jgi:CheY-like chemotaxis protein
MHKLLRRTLRQDIDIRTDLDPDLRRAFADPAQLESAMLNLALNAQDAMVSGGRLTLSTANASLDDRHAAPQPGILPGDYVMVSVIDDGEGMAREVAQRAFEPFYTTKEIGKGSGLGLSMVYGFVKQSDGHIFIQSAPGLGTTVRIYLPRAAEKTARFSERPSHDEAVLPRGTETVLVVEDDPFVRTSVVRRLRDLGYSVVAAVDGNDALGKLRTDIHVDILFTDIVMPGSVNGWELADLAKQIRPGLPVLLTSGYPIETLVQQGRLQAGAVVLAKPYRKEALARRLREILLIGSLSLGSEKPLVSRGSEFDKAK